MTDYTHLIFDNKQNLKHAVDALDAHQESITAIREILSNIGATLKSQMSINESVARRLEVLENK